MGAVGAFLGIKFMYAEILQFQNVILNLVLEFKEIFFLNEVFYKIEED